MEPSGWRTVEDGVRLECTGCCAADRSRIAWYSGTPWRLLRVEVVILDQLHDCTRKKRSEVAHMSRVHSGCDADARFQYRQHGWSPVCSYVNLSYRTYAMTMRKTISTSFVPLARLSAAWLERRTPRIYVLELSDGHSPSSAEPRLEEMSHHDGLRESGEGTELTNREPTCKAAWNAAASACRTCDILT